MSICVHCVDVCIIAALLSSCVAAEWTESYEEPSNRIQTDSWTEAVNELTTCYRQPGPAKDSGLWILF